MLRAINWTNNYTATLRLAWAITKTLETRDSIPNERPPVPTLALPLSHHRLILAAHYGPRGRAVNEFGFHTR